MWMHDDNIEAMRRTLESSYHGCHVTGGRHDYGKGFWNPNKKFAEMAIHGVCGYWFRKCKHCGLIDRWRTIYRYYWISHYNKDDERNIMETEGKHR